MKTNLFALSLVSILQGVKLFTERFKYVKLAGGVSSEVIRSIKEYKDR